MNTPLMDPAMILREIGGGLAGVVMVVQFLVIARLNKRNDALVDKLLDREAQGTIRALESQTRTLDAVHALTAAQDKANATLAATLAALEKRP